jgi:YfiH family protein
MKLEPARVVHVRQVHGAKVLVRRHGDRGGAPQTGDSRMEADIIVSNDPTVAVSVRAADCVPMLIVDRRTGAVAAAHAGWRGLALSVPAVTVRALAREFGSGPRDLLAAVGPSIRACCYEVGPDVRERFAEAGFGSTQVDRWFSSTPRPSALNRSLPGLPDPPRSGHWYFDSADAARDQLEAAGIPSSQIYTSDLCTASHPESLCSYRRDRAAAGRMAAVIRSVGQRQQEPLSVG